MIRRPSVIKNRISEYIFCISWTVSEFSPPPLFFYADTRNLLITLLCGKADGVKTIKKISSDVRVYACKIRSRNQTQIAQKSVESDWLKSEHNRCGERERQRLFTRQSERGRKDEKKRCRRRINETIKK
jgi:hypothetical protein